MWMDVGKLIREHVPDKNGKTLPADLTSGSYEFRDLTHTGVGTLFEGKVTYDKTYGHVAYGCATCCGYRQTSVLVWFDPLGVPFQGPTDNGVNAIDSCSLQNFDVSDSFYGGWSTANTSVATVDYYGTHSGVAVGSTTSLTYGQLQMYDKPWLCPIQGRSPGGGDNVTPTVTIDSFSPNPIATGDTANAHITVNPSANVDLKITSGGTGTATFGTSGNTTLTIPETTTVNITAGNQSSNGAADLTLTASYQGTLLDSKNFSVTSGACTATYSGHGGDGPQNCPAQVSVYDVYNLTQFCSTCSFTCIPINYDSTFTPSGCAPNTVGAVGSGNVSLTVSEGGNFAATDCNWHYLQIKTTVTNAHGVSTSYTTPSQNLGLRCTKYPNGNPCP